MFNTRKVTFTHKQIVKSLYFYKINLLQFIVDKIFALGNSSFGAVKLTKNDDPDKHNYSGYGTEFVIEILSLSVMSSLVHINNKKNILIIGEGPTDGLNDTKLTLEKEYSINFTEQQSKICLSLHYKFVWVIFQKDFQLII